MSEGRGIEIIPTCVPSTEAALAEGARGARAFASEIHIDITDGLFAPEVTWPYTEKGVFEPFDLSSAESLVREVHLMVEEPRIIGVQCAEAGAFRVLGHIEAFSTSLEARGALDAWRHAGAHEVGLAALLQTPLALLDEVVASCDVVHLMSIARIGTQGIPYESSAPARIAEFHAKHPDVLISVDGGVAESNIADLVRAGASRFGVGSAIAKATDPAAAFVRLKALAENATL